MPCLRRLALSDNTERKNWVILTWKIVSFWPENSVILTWKIESFWPEKFSHWRNKKFDPGLRVIGEYLSQFDSHYPKAVYRIVSNLGQGKGIQIKSSSPKSDRFHTKRFPDGLKLSIAANSSLAMAMLAKKRNATKMTTFNAIRMELRIK